MLIRARDRRPSVRLIVGPFFYLTWLRGTGPLTWPADTQGTLCCPHGMAAPTDNKEAFSVGKRPPFLISKLCCEDRYTCVSVSDVGRAAVFICCYMAEGDQMIGPVTAH